MRVGLDVSNMHKLSETRGIGVYASNLFKSVREFTDIDIELIEEKTNYDQFDLIHFPFFDLFKRTLPLKISKPFVVTIPDLIPLQFPKHYPSGLKGRANLFFQKLAIKNAKAIISISNTVKEDVSRILKVKKEKIFTTYLAPSNNFQKITDEKALRETKKKYDLSGPFVLYVGNVNWNKNILNTAESCIKAGRQLVIVGNSFLDKSNLNHAEKRSHKQFIEKYGKSEQIKLLGFVPNDDLEKLMSLAVMLIFISYYEGFGLPILEAQACELPVITSKGSATEEIAGESAILVDPEDPSGVAEQINRLFTSQSLRESLVKKGLENLKKYSWKQTALDTARVYKESINLR